MLKRLFHFIANQLAKRHLYLIRSLPYLSRKKRIDLRRSDYIRLSTLELIAEEIYQKNITGNVAELGVYKGDFAKDINAVFPDKKFYLFDTFEGFDNRDIAKEVEAGFSDGKQDFSDTSVEAVLAKMSNPGNCIVKKGFFPQSAEGVSDTFCFVSLDTDLYEPILAGLEFFYPRLSSGGYIFVHDFNNEEYKGARQAVVEFCDKMKIGFTPIADIGGTAVIAKG
jgi:O-methyltransferase